MTAALRCTLLLAGLAALSPFVVQAAESPAAQGQAIALDRGKGNCLACHTMQGSDVPSNVGPQLSGIKQRFPVRSELVAIIQNEEARNPQTVMPLFGRNLILTPTEIERVVDFLYTL